MKKSCTPLLLIFILTITSCQSTDKNENEKVENPDNTAVTEVVDSIPAEAVFMKVSQPDEVLLELRQTLGANENVNAFIGVDGVDELLITHVKHDGQHHLIFEQAADIVPLTLFFNNTDNIDPPFRVSIRHKVKDYATWKWLFDGDKKSRENAGMVLVQMGYVDGDPNELFMIFGIPDIARAREMMDKPNLKNKMKSGGVIGEAEVKFWRPVSNDLTSED